MTTTLASLATLVSRKRGDLEEHAATAAGTTTTLVCNTLVIGGDNEYAGDELLFTTSGLVRRVVSSVIATSTLTLAPALPSATQLGDVFEKRKRHLYADVVAAINAAIVDIQPMGNVLATPDTTLITIPRQYEYDVPTGLTWLYKVELEISPGDYEEVEPLCWDLIAGRKLSIAEGIVDDYTARTIRLHGYTQPTTLSARSDATALGVPFILAYCDWYLSGQKDGVDPRALSALYQTKEFERTRAAVPLMANSKKVLG